MAESALSLNIKLAIAPETALCIAWRQVPAAGGWSSTSPELNSIAR
jgi:hypothetical protein